MTCYRSRVDDSAYVSFVKRLIEIGVVGDDIIHVGSTDGFTTILFRHPEARLNYLTGLINEVGFLRGKDIIVDYTNGADYMAKRREKNRESE
jgi:hypothetical protein